MGLSDGTVRRRLPYANMMYKVSNYRPHDFRSMSMADAVLERLALDGR
jgi:hypothetical protein